MTFFERHATGTTMVAFILAVGGLSAAPVPDWMRPLGILDDPDPAQALLSALLSRRDSTSRVAHDVDESGPTTSGETSASEEAAQSELPKPEVAPLPRKERAPWTKPDRRAFEQLADRLGASARAIENPRSLDRFFAKLAQSEGTEEDATARIVTYGDSLIASDHITDMVRARLQERFGSGGKGFLLIDRLSRLGRRLRTGRASEGWKLELITSKERRDGFFGYTGASFTAVKDGAESVFTELGANRFAEVFYLMHSEGGLLEILADGELLEAIDTSTTSGVKDCLIQGLTLPEGAKTLTLRAKTAGVRLFGVVLEAGTPGVVFETIGLPGATSEVWLRPDAKNFEKQLLARDPALILTMLGGNDGLWLSRKWMGERDVEANTKNLIARLRSAAPDADCLVVAPMDSVRANVGGNMVSKREVQRVIAIQRKVALEFGCGHWDMWASMGGEGSLARWNKAGLINADLIHPLAQGGDLLGEMLVEAIMRAFDARIVSGKDLQAEVADVSDKVRHSVTSTRGSGAGTRGTSWFQEKTGRELVPFFEKLRSLSEGTIRRVAIAQFGGAHTAGHRFTDSARDILGGRFGYRGRGYTSAGRDSPVLREVGVMRALSGAFRVYEGVSMREGNEALIGMSGVRTDLLEEDASFSYRPCRDCPKAKSVFQVYYLKRPDMGRAEVIVSGAKRKVIGGRVTGEPQVGRVTRSTSREPSLVVRSLGPGTVSLFGVAHEFDRPGVVLDPIALPGMTPLSLLRWQQTIVNTMLADRNPDLLVLFWGTHEGSALHIEADAYRSGLEQTLRRLRSASRSPSAAQSPSATQSPSAPASGGLPCILLGPTSSMSQDDTGRWIEWPAIATVLEVQREVARDEGCSFWAVRDAMGGPGSIQGWVDEGLAREDHQAFTPKGYEKLGRMFAEDLLGRYDEWSGEAEPN